MPKAIDLLRQGRHEELWQMCCGFLSLKLDEFMEIQERLLMEQLELLNKSPLGRKIMRGARPRTMEEFREHVPLTTYKDYCPELLEKREDGLPTKPVQWVHTSGRSGEYPYKWVPLTQEYSRELSVVLYGVGMISCAQDWGDTSQIPDKIKLLYSVAPRPYISGTFADLLRMQTPLEYLPSLEQSEGLSFEERISKGFQMALSEGLDYFFGLSLVLVKVGEKLGESSAHIDLRPYLKRPRAFWRLTRGTVKSKLAGRHILPKDIWSLKGIIGSGIDSWVYKDKIKELWGKNPLDLYSCTEGGVIATQTWDYDGMTFIPNLNFLEFVPEDEQIKLEMDRTYIPKTLLLNEVKAGENYELIITSFHGGALVRYRLGDMVRITSLRNEKLGINLPQMVFERRVDDIIDFNVVRLTEKVIWQALEYSSINYIDWIAYKKPGQQILNLFIEPKDGSYIDKENLAKGIRNYVANLNHNGLKTSSLEEDTMDMVGFNIKVELLEKGTFSSFTAQRQAEGADLAHLKPPHISPSEEMLAILVAKPEKSGIDVKIDVKTETVGDEIT